MLKNRRTPSRLDLGVYTLDFYPNLPKEILRLWTKPLNLMSDNHTAFCHWAQRMINQFQKLLKGNGINHLRTRVNSTGTNGKIERFWRTLGEELLSREIFWQYQRGPGLAK